MFIHNFPLNQNIVTMRPRNFQKTVGLWFYQTV